MFLMSKKRKMKHVDTDDVDKQEEEADTEDIYDDEQREEMLDEDEITASENAFMQGREQTAEKKKRVQIEVNGNALGDLGLRRYLGIGWLPGNNLRLE